MSFDALFEGLDLNGADVTDAIRCIVELTYFESCIVREKTKPTIKVGQRIRQILKLTADQEIPVQTEKAVNREFSNFGRRKHDAQFFAIYFLALDEPKKWLTEREKRIIDLPLGAFSDETKKRIFAFLVVSLREDLSQFQEMRSELVYPDKLIKKLTDMLQNLARQFSIKDAVTITEKGAGLKASWSEEKANYDVLKQQLEHASPSEDTSRLESRLKQAQKKMSTFASELQKIQPFERGK